MVRSNLSKVLLKESIIFFSLKLFNLIFIYFFTWYVGKHLGLAELGNFTLFYSFIFVISIISRLGLDILSIKIVAEFFFEKRFFRLKQFIFISSSLILITSTILGLLSIIFLFFLQKISWFLLIWIGSICYSLYGFYLSILRGLGKIFWFSLLQEGILYAFTIIIFLIYNQSLQIAFTLSLITVLLLQIYLLRNYLPFSINFQKLIYISFIKKFFTVSISLYISQLVGILLNWIDIFLIQYFLGPKELGLYQILLRLVTLTSFVLTTINNIIAHRLAVLFKKKDIDTLVNLLIKINVITSLTGLLFVFTYAIFGKYLLNMFNIYQEVGYLALIIMSIGQLINSWAGPVGLFLSMTDYQIFHRNTLIVIALINIILNNILIPIFGILGAAIVYSLTIALWNIIFAYKAKKVLNKWISFFPLGIYLK
jgi:O-antigen/teichoic acid export membrane protein